MTPTELHAAVLAALEAAEQATPGRPAYAIARELATRHTPTTDGAEVVCAHGCTVRDGRGWPCGDYRAAVRLLPDLPAAVAAALGVPVPPATRLLPLLEWTVAGAAEVCAAAGHGGPQAADTGRACADCVLAAVAALFRGPILQVRFADD